MSSLQDVARLTAAVLRVSGGPALTQSPIPGSGADLPTGASWWVTRDHGGNARDLHMSRFHPTEQRYTRIWPDFAADLVSARATAGSLRDIADEINSAGQRTRGDTSDGTSIDEVSAARVPGNHGVTSVRDTADKPRVYTWDVDAQGQVRRTGESRAGDIPPDQAVTSTYAGGGRFVLSAVRLLDGGLRRICWDAALP